MLLLFRFIFCPPPLEKFLHYLGTFLLADTADYGSSVIQIGVGNDVKNGLRAPGLHIGTAINHRINATIHNGAAAHGAGLHRYV